MDRTDTPQFVILSKEEIAAMQQEAAEIGARAAMEKLEQERKNQYHKAADRRLHNTRLLLQNYRMLKEHADNSIYGRSQMEESAADVLSGMMNLCDDEVIVDAIKRSATRTAIIIAHIDAMLGIFEVCCEKSSNDCEIRRYEILYDMYIAEDPLTVQEIAEKWNMSKDSVYKDLRNAVKKLSAIIFGVDGLK